MKNLNIKLASFRHILILSFVVFTCSTTFAQLNKLTQQIDSSSTFYEINLQEKIFLDSLKLVLDSASYYSGGGEFREYKRFKTFWEPRLFPDITFERYMLAEQAYYGANKSNYAFLSNENWWEIGPKVPSTTAGTGVGPAEFITFFDNGTPASTQHMLAGSLPGGLFYSQDAGETWTPAGSDYWDNSGCSWAVFHPTNNQIWCASTSGNSATGQSSWMGYRGGIHLTTNAGQTWNLIADYNDLGGNWTIIQKIQFHPTNGNILYVATSNGLYKTENLSDQNIIWSKIIDNYAVYDFEFKPNNSNIIYATCRDGVWDRDQIVPWFIKKSINAGTTWSDMDTHNTTYLTIEVSKAQPDYLYTCILTGIQSTIRFFDGSTWSNVTPINYNMEFGHGHAFGVEQVQSGEQIITSSLTRIRHLNITNSTTFLIWPHYVDVEDVVFHPYNLNEVWAATHGGPEKSTDGGHTWTPKYNGFAAAMVSKMATSYTNPELIMLGLYHQGTVISRTNYNNNWNPAWQRVLGGDGQQPLIDNINPNNVWASHQRWGTTPIRYNNSFFQGGTSTNIPLTPIWQTLGVLNKNNSNFLYVNSCQTANVLQEEVLRFNSRGSTVGEYISDFENMLGNPDEVWMLGMVTPYYSDNRLIVWVRAIYNNNTESIHAFITNNATSPVPIWNELAIPRQGWVTDIQFNPSNPDVVYLCYGSPFPDDIYPYAQQLIYKIDYSSISNPVFVDITKNLPYTYTGSYCIETERGSDGRIYLSTDFGVFATDNELLSNDTWLRMGEGFPNCRAATGIEINYIKDLLRVGTEGRGIWEIPLPCDFSYNSIIINQNTTWNSFERINRNIIVKDGATLTIGANARISFTENSKLIIEPGGKLIVDGGKLTSACNGMWQGIEVWGDRNASQLTPGAQGTVELRNGAVIENSLQAIRTIATDGNNNLDWSKTGGIVKANNAVFRNNKNGVWIGGYENIHLSTGNPINNVSHITNCTFEINDNYIDGIHKPYEFIGLCDVSGIRILGNTFVNNHSSFSGQNAMRGIVSYDASYTVGPLCVAPTIIPCPQYQPNTFEGLYYGIHAQNTNPAKTVSIKNNVFNDTFRAVALKNINHAEVVLNEFLVGASLPFDMTKGGAGQTIPFFSYSYGLSLENCTGYRVEENDFGSNHPNAGFGVIVQNSGTAPNQIYNNSFEELKFAVRAQGLNGGSFASLKSGGTSMPVYLSSGLVIKCNDFSNINVADISVTSGSIAPNQNYCSNDTKTPANNLFTSTAPGVFPYNIWINPDAGNIKYSVNPDGTTSPVNYTTNKVDIGTPCSTAFAESSSCPSYLLPASPAVLKPQILSKSMYAQTLAAQFDGGNTQALLDNIYQNKPAGELKNTLIAASPYLSDTVLLATVKHKPSPLPPGILKEILVPNSPLSPNVMQAVVGRTPSLPGGIMNEINSVQHGVSERELLEKELAYIEGEIAMLEKMLIQTWLSDTTYNGRDSVIAWFENKPQTTENQQFLVEAYMANAQLTEAMQMLVQINQATASDSAFVAYYTILTDLYVAGENIFSLSPAHEQTMRQIAESQTTVSGNAQTVLWLVYGDEYELIIEELLLPDSMSIYGYLSSGAFCDYMPVAGDTLFLVDENMEPVAGMPYAVTNDDGYFIFNTHHFIFADTTKLYGISTKNAYQIDDVVFAPLHQLISSSPLELTHGDVRLEWFDLYAGPDSIYAIGTKIDLNGNIYVGGRTFQLNPPGNNIFLVKYSPQGERLWETVYNAGVTHLHEYLFDLETDSNGNSYMLFYSATTNDILLKFDDKGQLIWTAAVENIPNKKFRGINIEFDIYGNIIVAGNMDDYSQQTAKTDFFAAKFNENGQKIWLQLFDMSQNDNLMSMTTDKDGNIILSGSYYANSIRNGIVICYDNNGTLLWSNTYITGGSDIASVVKTDLAGNVYVAGNTDYINGFLLKYSPNGNLLWTDNMFSDLIPRALIIDSENMLYVGMEKWSSIYEYISYSARKYNENGNVLWQSTYENPDLYAARFNSVTIDNNNYLYASGYAMPDDSTENSVAVTVKMDFDGNFVRTDIFSVSNGIKHQGNNLVVSENNNIYVAGQCYDTESIKMFTVKYSQCHSQSGLRSDQWYPEEEDEHEADVLPVLSGNSILVYPNPYSGQTTIELSFEDASAVKAEVYTITGQRVCTLHEGNLQPGTHSFSFSAHSHGFSSGVYVLKVIINNESMHRMLIEME